LLAEIATPEVDQQLAQAQADLATAQANANNARIQAARLLRPRPIQRRLPQETDTFVNSGRGHRRAVKSREANVARLRGLKSFEKVYAPFDGVITARTVDTGQLIRPRRGPGAFSPPGHPDSARLRQPAPALLGTGQTRLQNWPHLRRARRKNLPGNARPHLQRTIDPASRTLLVEIDVENRSGELLPGSLTQVHFQDALRLSRPHRPRLGAHLPPGGDARRRFGQRHPRPLAPVVISEDDGANVQIVTGLGPGDRGDPGPA